MPSYPENKAIDDWLANETPEAVLEPDLPIIDPHHHLWDNRATDPGMGFEQRLYLCEEISNDITQSGHNIRQTVFAQCGAFYYHRCSKRTWLLRQTSVGFAPLFPAI
jgi:hypothetical protein